MQRLAFSVALLLGLAGTAVLQGQDAADKPKGKDKDKVAKLDATLEDYQNLGKLKEVTGKIAAVDVTAGTMTLTVDASHMEPNKNFNAAGANQKVQQQMQQIQREYNQFVQAKTATQRQQALARLQMHMAQNNGANLQNMYTLVKATKDFDLVVKPGLKVARSAPEQKFDDEGELVKYTDEQLKKMKSADITGAYTASPEDLKGGQGVKLYIDPPKDDKKKADSTDKKTDGSTADSKSTQQMPLSQVRMILITDESNVMDPADSSKKKKKKDN